MGSERRRHPRHARPFDGSWRGASGGAVCRITDVSISGCFVQSMGAPSQGEATTITITPADGPPIVLEGRMRYAEPGLGFGVEFENLTEAQLESLQQLMSANS